MTDTAVLPTPDAPPRHSGKARSIAAVIAFILAFGLLPIGMLTYWGHRTVTDAERYLETVQPLAYDTEVQDSLSIFITEKIEAQVDPEALVEQIFAGLIEKQPALKALVPVVSGAIDSLIAQVVDRLVRSEQFAELWTLANTAAQKGLMAILEGNDSGPVQLEGDQVVLDISSLIDAVKAGLVDRGLTAAENISIPDSDRQIVLLEAPQLAQVRTIYSFTSPIAVALIWVAALLFVVAILLARRRPRMVAWTGGAVAIAGGGLVVGLGIAQGIFVNTLEGTPFESASQVFYDTLLQFLYNGAVVFVVVGAILFLVGLYLCNARWARELRASINNVVAKIAASVPTGPISNSGAWVAKNARSLRAAVAVIFAAITLLGNDLSVSRTIWAAVISLILLVVVQLWAASAQRPAQESTPVAA